VPGGESMAQGATLVTLLVGLKSEKTAQQMATGLQEPNKYVDENIKKSERTFKTKNTSF
jgi:hypothetical protein